MATYGDSVRHRNTGDILLADGLIDELQLRAAIGHQKKWGGKIGSALVDLGILQEQDIAKLLERQKRERCLTASMMVPDPDALRLMSAADATRYVVLPLRMEGNELIVAMSNPSDLRLTDELTFNLKRRVRGVLAVETSIKNCIRKYYGAGYGEEEHTEPIDASPDVSPMEIIHNEKDAREALKTPAPEPKKVVEPTADVISKALAFLLIEKGIIKREELIERMKKVREKEKG